MRTAARLGSGSLGAYVISMSQAASDVLAVELLQKEARLMVRGCRELLHGAAGALVLQA
jgi:phosphoenolpyruvate carboxylase